MLIFPHLFLLIIFLIFSGICSASEIALVNLTPYQIHRLIKQGSAQGKRLIFWQRDPDRILITIAIMNNLANIAASAIAVTIFIRAFPMISLDSAAALATFVTTLLVLIFGEITPKLLGKRYPITISLRIMPVLIFFSQLAAPISKTIGKLSRGILNLLGKENQEVISPETHREEIKALLELVKKEGVVSDKENRMLMGILHLEKTKVREIMVNRKNMVCLEISTDYQKVLEVVKKSGFSRIPVYEKELDNIKGILMAKDILSFWDQKSFRLSSIIRSPKFMPEMITINQALRDFINTKTHLAIVVNEYGEVEGLITLEDIIEEIVGDIQDEFDTSSVINKLP